MSIKFGKPEKWGLHGKQGLFVQCPIFAKGAYRGVLYFDLGRQKWIYRRGFVEVLNTNKRNLAEAKASLEAGQQEMF